MQKDFINAAILAGGKGERMFPLTNFLPKALLPLLGATFLDYQIALLSEAGIEEIYVIVSYLKEKIEDFLHKKYPQIKIVEQKTPGFVGALRALPPLIKGRLFVCHVDNYISEGLKEFVKEQNCTFFLVKSAEQPKSEGVVVEEEFIIDVKEGAEFVNTGYYILTEEAEDVLMQIPLFPEEEGDVNLLKSLLRKGVRVRGVKISGWRRNINTPSVLFSVAKRLMDEAHYVFLPKGVRKNLYLKDFSTPSFKIIAPSWIGEGVYIKDSLIGPYAVIGGHALILSSRVAESIIWADVKIEKEDIRGWIILEEVRCEAI